MIDDLTPGELEMVLMALHNEGDNLNTQGKEIINRIIAKIEFHMAMAAVEALSL